MQFVVIGFTPPGESNVDIADANAMQTGNSMSSFIMISKFYETTSLPIWNCYVHHATVVRKHTLQRRHRDGLIESSDKNGRIVHMFGSENDIITRWGGGSWSAKQ